MNIFTNEPISKTVIQAFGSGSVSLAGLTSHKIYTLTSVENRVEHYDAGQLADYTYRINTVRPELQPERIQQEDKKETEDLDEREQKRIEVDCDLRHKERELLAKRLPKGAKRPVPHTVSLGQKMTFWVANSLNSQIQIAATCVKISKYANFFIQDNVDRKALTDEVIEVYVDVWDNTIYPAIRQTFGPDRDTDGDPNLYILFTAELNGFGAAGQFRADDKHPDHIVYSLLERHSNEKDIFYVEIPDVNDIEYDKSTLAHEFQHMISFDARNDQYQYAESIWLNEAFSGLAEYVAGFGNQGRNSMLSFLAHPASLTCWKTLNRKNYGGSYLFGRYLYEQFGADIIKKMVQNIGYYGLFNVENATGVDFNRIYNNWITALCLSHTGCSDDPTYNFTTINLRGNGFHGLKTYSGGVFALGTAVYCTCKPYCPLKLEWLNEADHSTITIAGDWPGGNVLAALNSI